MMAESLLRLLVRFLVALLYRIRVVGADNVPRQGPALLVANHVSLMDGFLVGWAARCRRVRFLIWRPYYEHWALRGLFRALRTIPIDNTGPRAMVQAIQAARAELQAGHAVCIFAEGSITRTGNLQTFKRGLEKIAEGIEAPIIPVHLDRLWGSIFSFAKGRFFGKRPRRWPYPVTVSFGRPMPPDTPAYAVRQAVAELGAEAFALRKDAHQTLPERFARLARSNWGSFAMADSTGRELTYGRTLTAALLLAGYVRRQCAGQQNVGLLLPSTCGGALANLGVTFAGKTAVNLNFTAGKEGMAHAIQMASVRTVITSGAFLAKAKLEAPEGSIYLEDILQSVSRGAKLTALLKARLAPLSWLLPRAGPDDIAVIIFSSGSTGIPKGILLTHFNIVSNVDAVLELFPLERRDRILGCLPLFHSFGYMATLWLPLMTGCGVVYHPVPTDAKTIGELIEKYKGTFLLSTPTFCQAYLRRCTREQFASLRFIVVGAEKLRDPLRKEFQERFGKELLEGYGVTEMAPVVAVNSPDYQDSKEPQPGHKPGTVGRPIPGVAARIVDPDTRQPLPPDQPGMLLVKGPNRMAGYLNAPELTAQVFHGDWYITGDIAAIDEDGFIRITDRLSRFSKIGGEMVPHVKIEELVSALTGGAPCAVVGLPDERKGERLAVLYTGAGYTPERIWRGLSASEIPNLWVPKLENIHYVESLPVLGSGKLDLRAVKALANALNV